MSTCSKATWLPQGRSLGNFCQAAHSSLTGNLAPPEWYGVWPMVLPCGTLCLLKAHTHLLFTWLGAPCDDVLTAKGRASSL